MSFLLICKSLDIHFDNGVAQEWLSERPPDKGFSLQDFKDLYGQILAAQGPGVRQAMGNVHLRGKDMVKTEDQMRTAFKRFSVDGFVSIDGLRQVLSSLSYPDMDGDIFDRFSTEFFEISGKDTHTDSINFHEFAQCVNLLVDVCEKRRDAEATGG